MHAKRKALITGITGQDGSYLADLLLEKDYEVHGVVRQAALDDPEGGMSRIRHLKDKVQLHAASLESYAELRECAKAVQPDECFHLGAQSFVGNSFNNEFATMNTNINGTHYMLAAIHEFSPECRFFFAGSSEMFGKVKESPQNETTRFHPRSAYGISKVTGFNLTRNYREAYGMYACSGILFNHESPRRGLEFVTRKITHYAALIAAGKATELPLGNLDARRDWGHARDYVEGAWRMLQQDEPHDLVLASGELHTVREFCDKAFSALGLNYEEFVKMDPRYYRPAEAVPMQGDAALAAERLAWRPTCTFEQLIAEMVDADVARARLSSRQ